MTQNEDIKRLLGRYFEGETSHAEELRLRQFFTKNENLSEEFSVYSPLFSYFEEESKKNEMSNKHRNFSLLYAWSAIAACLLVLVIVATHSLYLRQHDNYVIINGEKSTNIYLAEKQAKEAFNEVSFSEKDVDNSLFPQEIKESLE